MFYVNRGKNDNNKLIIDIVWAAVFFHVGFKNDCFPVNTIDSLCI